MEAMLLLFKMHLNIIYLLLKLFKTQEKVLFMSRQSNKTSMDMQLLINDLTARNPSIKCVVMCNRLEKNTKSHIKYYFLMFKQMYHLATSKVCVIDCYIPVISILKHKKKLKIIQLWHSLGAIKKFGYQNIGYESGRNKTLSKCLNMHKNYDYIISGSLKMTEYFSEAFNYDKRHFYNYGTPKMDYILKNKEIIKADILAKYKGLDNKINILYAPTFRTDKSNNINELIEAIDFNKYNLIIKNHKSHKLKIKNKNIFTCNDIEACLLLTVTDHLITDYSGIAIEAAYLDVKTYYYLFDIEKYELSNGVNVDLFKEMPTVTSKDIKDIMVLIENDVYNFDDFNIYRENYVSKYVLNSSKKIIELIKREFYYEKGK